MILEQEKQMLNQLACKMGIYNKSSPLALTIGQGHCTQHADHAKIM